MIIATIYLSRRGCSSILLPYFYASCKKTCAGTVPGPLVPEASSSFSKRKTIHNSRCLRIHFSSILRHSTNCVSEKLALLPTRILCGVNYLFSTHCTFSLSACCLEHFRPKYFLPDWCMYHLLYTHSQYPLSCNLRPWPSKWTEVSLRIFWTVRCVQNVSVFLSGNALSLADICIVK